MLATLGLGVEFYEVGGTQAVNFLFVGQQYEARVIAQDIRTGDDAGEPSAGVIALPLNYSWDNAVLSMVNEPTPTNNLATDPVVDVDALLVTPDFPLQRQLLNFTAGAGPFDSANVNTGDPDRFYNLEGVSGGAIPSATSGQAIGGTGQNNVFGTVQFQVNAIPASGNTTFTINLDGAMSFADADVLRRVEGISGAAELNFPNADENQTVQATINVGIVSVGGTKTENIGGSQTIPGTDVTMNLDFGNDSILTGANDQTIVTASDGTYQFDISQPGRYSIQEVLPGGRVRLSPADDKFVFDVTTAGVVQPVPPAGVTAFNFVNQIVLSGSKFEDSDQDGTRDPGEAGTAGVTILLDLETGDPTSTLTDRTAVTDLNGDYRFEGVPLGNHLVTEVAPTGSIQTAPTTGGYEVNVTTTDVAVQSADSTTVAVDALDFGNFTAEPPRTISLSGYVYTDSDSDGAFESDEFGLAGVEITLISQATGTAVATTMTGPDGWYNFENLAAGTYNVVETQPRGYTDASITRGTVEPSGEQRGTAAGSNMFVGINLASSDTGSDVAVNYNFGENLRAVTKRNFTAMTNVRQELFRTAGVSSRLVRGTAGDDVISVDQTNDNWRISVNGATTLIPLNSVDVIQIDAGSGNDTFSYIGTEADEEAHLTDISTAIVAPGGSLLILGTESTSVDGRRGTDLAVIEGSQSTDQLNSSRDQATLTSGATGNTFEALGFDSVRAVSNGSRDQSTAAAIDFVLELIGDWNQ